MNSTGVKDLGVGTRLKGMAEQLRQLSGVSDEPLFSEGFSNLKFPELDAEVEKADTKCFTDVGNAANRMDLIYAMAVARDAKYAYAGRKFVMAVGEQEVFRGLYEGGKLTHDASK